MSKAHESKGMARVARNLIRLSGVKPVPGISIYALAINEALKATNQASYSGSARSFIKKHLFELQIYCGQNSNKLRDSKTESKQKRAAYKSGARLLAVVSKQDKFVASDQFLSSFEWRRVRMMALKKYGPVCMCCGASPLTGAVMNVDHIKPRKLFPQLALDVDNLQILCHECNHGKGNWDMTDWRQAEEMPLGKEESDHIKSITESRW